MKTFSVILTRDLTESCVVKVQAENKEAAEDLALDGSALWVRAEWNVDDGSNDDHPYVTGCDEEEDETCPKQNTKESTTDSAGPTSITKPASATE